MRTGPRDPTSLHLHPLEPSRGPPPVALRDCAPRRRWHRNAALQETGHLTFNHSASPGRFEACCFFILRYPHRELLLIINPAVTVKLTICYAFHMLSTLYVSSCFIPESYTINKAVPSFKKKIQHYKWRNLNSEGTCNLLKISQPQREDADFKPTHSDSGLLIRTTI